MRKGWNPKYEKRSKLLRILMDRGMSLDTILEITQPMKGKSDSEKDQIAEQIMQRIQNEQ